MSKDFGGKHPGLVLSDEIRTVVKKLRFYLGNDNNSLKSTLKKLDVLEDRICFLHPDNLQQVKPNREEMAAAWLQKLKTATKNAKELLNDMESEVKASKPSTSDIMTWLCSDNRNMIRMIYTISRLASICTEGESVIDATSRDENSSKDKRNDTASLKSHDAMSAETEYLTDHDFFVGRDVEITMIKDMVLGDGHYVPVAASLEGREESDKLTISQKGWIIQILKNIDLSKKAQKSAELPPSSRKMRAKVQYNRLGYDHTVSNLWNPMVIPIVGLSGVGKSALAQFIFNDRSVQEHFGGQAWVYMTERINLEEIVMQIIFSFGHEQASPNPLINPKDVRDILQRIIEGKRFFLVLDNVWDEIHEIWGDLRSILNKGAPESVVLVTTQLFSVASSLGTTGPIVLDQLGYNDSWPLFKHYAFADPCSSQSMEALELIGRKIAERLDGLPLAAKLIGASLRTNLKEDTWGELMNSFWWTFSDDNVEMNSIISSIGSCYHELPGYLKQCFVYCSIFPRNFVFERCKLAQMWIANGFVQVSNATGDRSLENIADKWFGELVNRAILQPSACKTGYVMHEVIRDFARALSSNEYHGVSDSGFTDFSKSRYLSIEIDNLSRQQGNSYGQLRTLMLSSKSREFFGNAYQHIDNILMNSNSLRILDFSSSRWSRAASQFFDHWAQENYEQYSQHWLRIGHQNSFPGATRELSLPLAISELKYLKYLDLSYTGINTLPDSICSLFQLHVLDLRGCTFHMLPESMNSLISLHHLRASTGTIAQIYGIGKLTKLQRLHEFCVKAEDGHRIAELRDLNDIGGSLSILNLEMVNDPRDVLQANIDGKRYLTDLELKWSNNIQFEETLIHSADKLVGNSPINLQALKLFGYPGFAFPDRVGQLKHVRVIEITSCERLLTFPSPGQLEHLQKLKLHSLPLINHIGFSEPHGTSNVLFQSLEELSFEEMRIWESWTYEGSGKFIPNLQKLQIVDCGKLKEVPFESLGSSIKDLCLRSCGRYAPTISEYLIRLTHLIRLEIHCTISEKGEIVLPCAELRSLEYLRIDNFSKLCIKGGLWYIKNLKDLRICRCDLVTIELDEVLPHEEKRSTTFFWNRKRSTTQCAQDMHSLAHLTLGGNSVSNAINEFLPKTPFIRTLCVQGSHLSSAFEQWLQQLTSLQVLEISCYRRKFPSSLPALASLKRLVVVDCCQFDEIPPNSLPRKLKELQIEQCSMTLEARCQKPGGEAWKKEKLTEWRQEGMEEWRSSKIRYGETKMLEVLWSARAQEKITKKREVMGDSSIEEPQVKDQTNERGKARQRDGRLGLTRTTYVADLLWQLLEMKEACYSNVAELLKNTEDKWLLGVAERFLLHNDTYMSGMMRVKDALRVREVLLSMEAADEHLKNDKEKWLKKSDELIGKDWPNIAHVPYIRVNGDIIQNLYT